MEESRTLPQHIIFDWGGVLAPQATRTTARALAKKYKIKEQVFYHDMGVLGEDYMTGKPDQEFFERLGKSYKVDPQEIKEMFVTVRAWGVYDVARSLVKAGYRLSLLTNQGNSRAGWIKENYDLSFFTEAIFSNEVGLAKPDPAIFRHILSKLQAEAENCLFIDDNLENIRTARDLGFQTIFFSNRRELLEELKSRGFHW